MAEVMKMCKKILKKEILQYLFPLVLGICIMLFVRWKWFWAINERIFQVSYEENLIEWGNSLLRLVVMLFLAVWVKWNIRKEVFYDKGKMALKRKIIWLLFLIFMQDVGSEVIWKLHGYGEGIYDNSYWMLGGISSVNILSLSYILAAALTEELFFRYITCNCLRRLHINCGVIVILQAAIFAVVHRYEWIDLLNVFMSGIVYGSILYLTRTPVCSWILHSAYNLKVIFDGPLENYIFLIATGLCVIYVVISETMYKKKLKRKKRSRSAGNQRNSEKRNSR